MRYRWVCVSLLIVSVVVGRLCTDLRFQKSVAMLSPVVCQVVFPHCDMASSAIGCSVRTGHAVLRFQASTHAHTHTNRAHSTHALQAMSEEELVELAKIRDAKQRYRDAFGELQMVKSEVCSMGPLVCCC